MNIEEIKTAYKSGSPIEYKAHCLKRMMERDISRKDIEDCILNGEIIEDYPLDSDNASEASYPSCLILWIDTKKAAIHVVVGFNGRKIIVISAYHPDNERWESDHRTRKER